MSDSAPAPRVRCFFALPLAPDAVRALLRAPRASFDTQSEPAPLRWLGAEQLHVTLKFLGHVESTHVPRLIESLTGRARATPRLVSVCGGVTAFPSLRRANVLVLRLQDEGCGISRLAGALEDDAALVGVPREQRSFKPHVTLARLKRPADVTRTANDCLIELREVCFEQVCLYASTLTRTGSVYSLIASAPLSG
jgi:2'-5' RNA ligase